MTDVLVLGQPYWAQRIASAIDAGGDLRARFVPQRDYLRLLAGPAGRGPAMLVRAGYRVGGTTPRGRLFDAYWQLLRARFPRAHACHYWLGTDVLDTLSEARAGTLRRRAVDRARADLHIADAPWLAAELDVIGLHANVVHVPQPYRSPATPVPLPETFSVLTYFPGERRTFYGGDTVLEAARRLPDIEFAVVGRIAPEHQVDLPNVRWLGWVADMGASYEKSSVVVRLPQHDGLGATVVEGLLHARHIIYSYPLPHVRTLQPVTVEGLVAELTALRDAHASGTLSLNLDGRAYALREYDPECLSGRLAALIRSAT